MGLRVNTNVASLTAQRNLSNTTTELQRSLARLSSGLRITRASDDAAGLAISERFRADVRSLQQAQRNGLDGVSALQIAEGALNEVSGILTRLRELAIQSASDSVGDSERTVLNNEFTALVGEISRIGAVTEFNGQTLLDGTTTTLNFQIGINATTNDQISITSVDATATGLSLTGAGIATSGAASTALATVDAAIDTVSANRGSFGVVQNRLESAIRSIAVAVENTAAAESRIRDVDVASETAILTRNQVLQQAGISVLSQANFSSQNALALLQ